MKKKLITTLLLLLVCLSGYSQISWNAKAGINISNIINFGDVDFKPGYQVGVGMDYYFNDHWGVQPSLLLISKGYKDKGDYYFPPFMENSEKLKSYDITDNKVYVELPLLLTYRFNVSAKLKLIFSGGGYIAYGITGKFKNTNTLLDGSKRKDKVDSFSAGVEKFDTGLAAGAALEYNDKYSIGLSSDFGLRTIDGRDKNRTYGLSFGYRF